MEMESKIIKFTDLDLQIALPDIDEPFPLNPKTAWAPDKDMVANKSYIKKVQRLAKLKLQFPFIARNEIFIYYMKLHKSFFQSLTSLSLEQSGKEKKYFGGIQYSLLNTMFENVTHLSLKQPHSAQGFDIVRQFPNLVFLNIDISAKELRYKWEECGKSVYYFNDELGLRAEMHNVQNNSLVWQELKHLQQIVFYFCDAGGNLMKPKCYTRPIV